MRTWTDRNHNTMVKLNKRKRMMHSHGLQGGSLYKKHREKVGKSLGYMRDGNAAHYICVGYGVKTRDKKHRGEGDNLSRRDTNNRDRLNHSLYEYSEAE